MEKNRKALIFGSGGQDGYYLNNLLLKNGLEVITSSRKSGKCIGTVTDYLFAERIIKHYKPDFVFNFAAISNTSHDYLFDNHETITVGTLNILEAVFKHAPHCKVFLSGSGLQFENNGNPIIESDPFEARDVYSIARIHTVYAGRYYRRKGVQVYIGYFFNHDSYLRSEKHINQRIVIAAKEAAIKQLDYIEIGDISVRKEFSFAGDIMEALWLFINNNEVFELVIGSGKAYSIEYWLDLCFSYFDLNWVDYVRINPDFVSDHKTLVSNPKTIRSLGWAPKLSIEELAVNMIKSKFSSHE